MSLLPQVEREKDTSSIAMSPAKLLPLRPSITTWKEKKSNCLSTFIYLQQPKLLIICINYVLYNGQKNGSFILPMFMPMRKIKLNFTPQKTYLVSCWSYNGHLSLQPFISLVTTEGPHGVIGACIRILDNHIERANPSPTHAVPELEAGGFGCREAWTDQPTFVSLCPWSRCLKVQIVT